MSKRHGWILAILMFVPLVLMGCGDYGKVDQGRVITLDKDKKTVTLIRDAKADPQNPDYDHLPPVTYTLPAVASEMGPEPKTGMRIKLDTKARKITIFDPATQNFKILDYTLIDQKENVAKDNPLVYDKAEGKAKKLPLIDRDKKTITIYSSRQKILTTLSLPDEYFSLPDSTWEAGDEVRIYYKEDGKALRFMNVSRTDIYKK